jgi:hypothetical protein
MKIPATLRTTGEIVYIVKIDSRLGETVCINDRGRLVSKYLSDLTVLPGKFRPVAPKKGALLIGAKEE